MRQKGLRVEARGGDLAAVERRVTLSFSEAARRDLCAARHLPSTRNHTPELQVRNRGRMRGARLCAVGSNDPVDGTMERFGCARKLGADRLEIGIGALRQLDGDLGALAKYGARDRTAVARRFAPDEIVGLDAGGALVDGRDASIAEVLGGTGLLDVAHAAMHLYPE